MNRRRFMQILGSAAAQYKQFGQIAITSTPMVASAEPISFAKRSAQFMASLTPEKRVSLALSGLTRSFLCSTKSLNDLSQNVETPFLSLSYQEREYFFEIADPDFEYHIDCFSSAYLRDIIKYGRKSKASIVCKDSWEDIGVRGGKIYVPSNTLAQKTEQQHLAEFDELALRTRKTLTRYGFNLEERYLAKEQRAKVEAFYKSNFPLNSTLVGYIGACDPDVFRATTETKALKLGSDFLSEPAKEVDLGELLYQYPYLEVYSRNEIVVVDGFNPNT